MAVFKLGIDSKLCACDGVSLKVEDRVRMVITVGRAMVRERKPDIPSNSN